MKVNKNNVLIVGLYIISFVQTLTHYVKINTRIKDTCTFYDINYINCIDITYQLFDHYNEEILHKKTCLKIEFQNIRTKKGPRTVYTLRFYKCHNYGSRQEFSGIFSSMYEMNKQNEIDLLKNLILLSIPGVKNLKRENKLKFLYSKIFFELDYSPELKVDVQPFVYDLPNEVTRQRALLDKDHQIRIFIKEYHMKKFLLI